MAVDSLGVDSPDGLWARPCGAGLAGAEFTWPLELISKVWPAAAVAAASKAYNATCRRFANQCMGFAERARAKSGAGAQISCALMPVETCRLVCGGTNLCFLNHLRAGLRTNPSRAECVQRAFRSSRQEPFHRRDAEDAEKIFVLCGSKSATHDDFTRTISPRLREPREMLGSCSRFVQQRRDSGKVKLISVNSASRR